MKLDETYYSLLGIDTDASEREIQDAYRNKIRIMHPDVNKSPDAEKNFLNLHKAYQVLGDPDKRAEYDSSIGVIDKKSVFREFSDGSDSIRKEKKLGLEDEPDDMFDEAPEHEPMDEKPDFLSKMNSILNQVKPKKAPQDGRFSFEFGKSFKKIKKLSKDILFGERTYNFSINALESVLGTERQLVIKDLENKTRKILVKIPAGIPDKSTLQVPVITALESKPKVEVSISDHPYLKRERSNLTLLIPFHEKEKRTDESVVLFTASSEVKITIPKENFKALRIKEHGLSDKKTGARGDFLILPFLSTESIEEDQPDLEKKFKERRQKVYNLLKPLHKATA